MGSWKQSQSLGENSSGEMSASIARADGARQDVVRHGDSRRESARGQFVDRETSRNNDGALADEALRDVRECERDAEERGARAHIHSATSPVLRTGKLESRLDSTFCPVSQHGRAQPFGPSSCPKAAETRDWSDGSSRDASSRRSRLSCAPRRRPRRQPTTDDENNSAAAMLETVIMLVIVVLVGGCLICMGGCFCSKIADKYCDKWSRKARSQDLGRGAGATVRGRQPWQTILVGEAGSSGATYRAEAVACR